MPPTFQGTIKPKLANTAGRAADQPTWTAVRRHICNLRGGRSELHAAALGFIFNQEAEVQNPAQTTGAYERSSPRGRSSSKCWVRGHHSDSGSAVRAPSTHCLIVFVGSIFLYIPIVWPGVQIFACWSKTNRSAAAWTSLRPPRRLEMWRCAAVHVCGFAARSAGGVHQGLDGLLERQRHASKTNGGLAGVCVKRKGWGQGLRGQPSEQRRWRTDYAGKPFWASMRTRTRSDWGVFL